jgi:hypothetical protein
MSPAASNSRLIPRRRLLQIGALGPLGLNLAGLLRAAETRSAKRSKSPVKSCILIFYYGGPSHHDTWDMKPHAPREVRGEFQPIATTVPGLPISEHLPHCARVMDKLAIVRSLHHPMTNHNAAAFAVLCGRNPLKGDLELLANDRNDPPCYGSALSRMLPGRPGVPPFVALPHVMYNVVVLPGQIAGFLGSNYDPFQVSHDPNAPDFRLDELELPADISLDRLDHRARWLRFIDDQERTLELIPVAQGRDAYNERAFQLLHSARVRRAFELGREDPRLRDRYGRTTHGQSVLLARRLVEAGVRFVCVYDHQHNGPDNWDTHDNNFGRLKEHLLPPTDRALAALVEDLSSRGLLDETLVIVLGEFGRTPRLNPAGGRDHWPFCYCAVFAGGGVAGGTTFGSSDKLGAYPDADPVTPADLAATIYWRFGLDPATEIADLTGRPYRLADGQPMRALFPGAA